MTDSKEAFELSAVMQERAAELGRAGGISDALHSHDQLLGFFIHKCHMDPISAVDTYFSSGASDAAAVAALARQIGIRGEGRILEFASGYGRVTRHLKHSYTTNLTASDVHSEACTFISNIIGVPAVLSASSPGDFLISDNYDFIFVLSFFSHVCEINFGPWLSALYRLLAPGGHLMFTTHGEFAMRKFREFFEFNYDKELGFGFRPESDQEDLSDNIYGTAVVAMHYVSRSVERFIPDAHVISMHSGTWFGLQDQWLIRRPG